MGRTLSLIVAMMLLAGCSAPVSSPSPSDSTAGTTASVTTASPSTTPTITKSAPPGRPFAIDALGRFDEPWAMTFLPSGELLITERGGSLKLRAPDGKVREVAGALKVVHDGQGGLGDAVLSPGFAMDRLVYLSWVERGEGGTGAAVG